MLIALASTLMLSSCKKFIEQQAQDALISLMTTGEWKMVKYTVGSTDITSIWDGYTFKFYSNLTVDAKKNGTVQCSGTWNGNYSANTFSATFPAPANDTVTKLNGTWYRDASTGTSVDATNTGNGDKLKLVKQ